MAVRDTQVATETLAIGSSNARITQVAEEVLAIGASNARLTQIAVEILVPNVAAAANQPIMFVIT